MLYEKAKATGKDYSDYDSPDYIGTNKDYNKDVYSFWKELETDKVFSKKKGNHDTDFSDYFNCFAMKHQIYHHHHETPAGHSLLRTRNRS